MRVLQVHNRYRSASPSGENTVVDAEASGLAAAGVEVIRYIRSSDEIEQMGPRERAALPVRPFYSRTDVAAVSALLSERSPDLVHLHNPNPLISMAVVGAAERHGVPVVMTVHNHRHTCVKGSFYRDGHQCHDCRGHSLAWPGVLHACYRDSRAQSVVAVAALRRHRSSYARVARFVAISTAMRDELQRSGVPEERIVVKPNSVPDADPTAPELSGPARFLFVGRLDEEKGLELLLKAWCARADWSGARLAVAGSGPLEARVRDVGLARDDLEFLGRLDPDEVGHAVASARAILVPSVWEEPFGLVVLEAYARARPVVSTGAGGLSDLLHEDCSWRVPPEPAAWTAALGGIDAAEAARRGRAARQTYESTYTPVAVTAALIAIYEQVLAER